MASGNYNKIKAFLDGTIDFDLAGTAMKVLLLKATYAFDRTHNFVSDVSAHECVASGYARQALANRTITEDDTNNRVVFDADDVAFGAVGSPTTDQVRFAVVFRDTGTAGTSELMTCIDLGVTYTLNGGTFTVQWNASGITYLQN